jgi:hypothetical protein
LLNGVWLGKTSPALETSAILHWSTVLFSLTKGIVSICCQRYTF